MESGAPQAFEPLAWELFEWHARFNPAYARFCQRHPRPPSWRQIPALPTAAFKELDATWLAPADRVAVFHSSGTTQLKPSRHYHSGETLAVYEASLLRWFKRHLTEEVAPRFSFLALTPSLAQAPHSSLVHMFATLKRDLAHSSFTFGAYPDAPGVWQLDVSRIESTLREACDRQLPLILLGPAFAYVQLMEALGSRRFYLPPWSRAMETGGYKGRARALRKEDLRRAISHQFGLPAQFIVGEYGMSELSSQAYDHRAGEEGNTFRFPPWARVLIISPETGHEVAEGEDGLIRVVDLANVSSAPAIQTADLGIRRGDGFEWIGRATDAEPRGCSLMIADEPRE